jgi:hypothetical protein
MDKTICGALYERRPSDPRFDRNFLNPTDGAIPTDQFLIDEFALGFRFVSVAYQ